MRFLIASSLSVLLLSGCTKTETVTATASAETTASSADASATTTQAVEPAAIEAPAATGSASQTTADENLDNGTWTGQIAFAQPVSMFNYVGADSGDFAPMRFRNDSEVGKKILAVCSNGQMCEFTGAVEWLDEPPPENASAIGQIVRIDSVKRAVEP